jgi:dipeptidyl aminopeptidase/acylaminoacyl peptidase
MKIKPLLLLLLSYGTVGAQTLTVEKIMRDPKWIGTSPSNVFWSADSKNILFSWNPKSNVSDSVFSYALSGGEPQQVAYLDAQRIGAMNNAVYNSNYSQMAYVYRGDIYLQDIKAGKTTRVTQTEEIESAPKFILQNEWLVYTRNQNLYAWNTRSGITQQLTNITRGAEAAAARPAGAGGQGGFGGGGNRGGGATGGFGGPQRSAAAATEGQEQWLQQQQQELFGVLKDRKQKKDLRDAYIKSHKESDTLKTIGIGEKTMQGLQVSPDSRFVTYRLYQAPTGAKGTIVPDYVTESGFTTDIPGRTKVGAALGKYDFYVYDRTRDTVMLVGIDSIPGITDQPDYVKDYPKKFANKKAPVRGVMIAGPYWNEAGTVAVVDIRSQDNKDRWLMQLDPITGKLSLLDRQRDEAWIGGPGVSGFGARIGWVNDNNFYFQSEATGYSHLYIYDVAAKTKKALTEGKYEVQAAELSRNKQWFYLLTNEEHPGKQGWYRISSNGGKKDKITSMEGGYEVSMSPDEKWIAYRYSYSNKPWELFVQENAPGKKATQVTNLAASAEFKQYPWREPEVISFTARDGAQVYARIYQPTAAKKNNAAVLFVHGAGYLQNVHYWWSSYFREYMFNNMLTDLGYTVLDIDYRASSGYGRDARTGIYRWMGGKDLDDHVDGAKLLVEKYGVDPARIGLYGGSYGGFITLMALFTTPDVFKAGAALRPVTDWAHYNHGYTSNILNEPFNDSLSYAKSSPINFAAGLKNHLLICHGMVDVNVNFQDAVRLQQKLIELGKDNWEVAAYPVEDHGFVEPSSWTDEYKRILKLFNTTLLK